MCVVCITKYWGFTQVQTANETVLILDLSSNEYLAPLL